MRYENSFVTTIKEAIEYYEENEPKGEFVLVVKGKDESELKEEEIRSWDQVSLEDHMKMYLDKGMNKKEAMKAVASDRGVSKRDIYKLLIEE